MHRGHSRETRSDIAPGSATAAGPADASRDAQADETEEEDEDEEQTDGSYYSEEDDPVDRESQRKKVYQSYNGRSIPDDSETFQAQQGNAGSSPQGPTTGTDDLYPLDCKVIAEIVLCVLAFAGRGLCLNSLGPTMIDLRQLTSTSVEDSALIFVSQSAGFMAGSFAAKPILKRFNNELSMSVLLLIQAIFTALVPTTQILALMCLAFVGQGFAIGVVGIGVTALCIKLGGPKRNGMFLQAVYLGVSIGSVVGPFMAQPFLSREIHVDGGERIIENSEVTRMAVSANKSLMNIVGATMPSYTPTGQVTGNTSLAPDHVTKHVKLTPEEVELQINTFLSSFYTQTNVLYAYIVIGLILTLPCMGFMLLYLNRDRTKSHVADAEKPSESLSFTNCTTPLFLTVALLLTQCLIYFGMQDSYSNLLTTYVVLSDLHLHKSRGVYVTSLFWAAVCVGRLNGIWIAKFASPFAMLMGDVVCALVCSVVLAAFGDSSEHILWAFTFLLGLSFASINAATVAWAARHISSNNYLLSLIMVGRCSGLLVVPTVITELIPVLGADTLMHALVAVCIMHLICLVGAQVIVHRHGTAGRISGKRKESAEEMKFVQSEIPSNNIAAKIIKNNA